MNFFRYGAYGRQRHLLGGGSRGAAGAEEPCQHCSYGSSAPAELLVTLGVMWGP